jgi:tetratricopeptide (TPR) repeat protein
LTRQKPSVSPKGPSALSIVAFGFLIFSLIASIAIIRGAVDHPPAMGQATPDTPLPITPVRQPAVTLDSGTPTASPESLSEAEVTPASIPHLEISLIALPGSEDSSFNERLMEAIQAELSTLHLPDTVVIRTEPTDQTDLQAVLALAPRDDNLRVIWNQESDGLTAIFLAFPLTTPPISRLETPLNPWDIGSPDGVPVYVAPDGRLDFVARLVAGSLQMMAGQAPDRLATLQAVRLEGLPQEALVNNQAVAYFGLGLFQTAGGERFTALRSYSQSIRLKPDFAVALVNRGNIYLELGDPVAALDAYNTAESFGANPAVLAYNRALAYRMAGDTDSALAEAAQATSLSPEAAWSTNLEGLIYYSAGNYEAALDAFSQAQQYAPDDASSLFNQAVTLFTMGQYDQSLLLYDTLLELEPDNPVNYLHQGLAYRASGQAMQAVHAFSRAIMLDETYLEAYVQRAHLYVEEGQTQQALWDVEKILALDPNDGRAYWITGDALLVQEQFAEAKTAYTQAIDLGEVSAEVYAGRGWAWHRLRYTEAAIRDYEQALMLGANTPTLLYRLGFALFDAGRYEDARDALLGAVNSGLDTAEAHAVLALAFDANLQRQEAEQEYRRALELDPRYGRTQFLAQQPLWSQLAVTRASAILRRLDLAP